MQEAATVQNLVQGRGPVLSKALKDSVSLPAFILFTSMTGFGALARAGGFGVDLAAVATLLIWGLPGQVAMVELVASGSGILAAVIACSLANARFMPMTVSFLPLIRERLSHRGWLFVLAQLLSINSWAMCLRRFPDIQQEWRRFYYVCFALSILSAAVAGTVFGYYVSGSMPQPVVLGLIFLSPLFFALLLSGIKGLAVKLALLAGVLLMPLAYNFLGDMDLLVTGLVGGTLAYGLSKSPYAKRFST